MSRSLSFAAALLLSGAVSNDAAAQPAAASGFSLSSLPIGPGAGAPIVGGLARLPSGALALFDGTSVVSIDPSTGAVLATLYVPPATVFGAVLAVDPAGSFVLFGESSQGVLTKIPLDGSAPSRVATVDLQFDAAFDSTGGLLVSRGTPSWTATEIVRVDLASSALDLIATLPGPSGPLLLLADGALLYAEVSPIFPAPPGSGRLLRFDASQVASAIGPSHLTELDAAPLGPALDAPYDLALDGEGDIWISDSIQGRIDELAPDGTPRGTAAALPSGGFTHLAFVADGSAYDARFNAFQPESGGTLAAVASDYSTFTAVAVVKPRRAQFTVLPANPVPPGAFRVELDSGPPFASCYLFVSATTLAPEWKASLAGIPYFFALAPPGILFLGAVPLDGAGALSLPATNPSLGVTVMLQGALFGPPNGGIGSTEALALALR